MIDMNNFDAKVNKSLCKDTYLCMCLSLKVLELLYLLVKYGYFSNLKDINALMPPLCSILNGMNDKPYPGASVEQSYHFRKVNTMINICMVDISRW